MTDRWSEIDAIVSDALAIDPPKRILFITEVCGTDQELAREVLSLLKACEASDGFLEQPVLAGFSDGPLIVPSAIDEPVRGANAGQKPSTNLL